VLPARFQTLPANSNLSTPLLFSCSYRNCYTPLSLILCSYLLQFDPWDRRAPLELFQCTLLAFMPLHLLLTFGALIIDICGE
jgi:hypothetical protein